MTDIISTYNLVKHFPEVTAVDGVSFSVQQGSCFGLLGPNGAGKTTTIEMMEGITAPSGGEIRIFGELAHKRHYQKIGIQFQETSLQDYLTVRETMQLFASFYSQSRPIEELIELCSLQDYVDRDNRKLSGGQRQRMLLALALINDPKLVFLDEPTTGLDPQARRNFWELIKKIKAENKTIILTTHYMEEASYLCDEVAIMDKGKIVLQGTPEALLKQHFDGVILRLPAEGLNRNALELGFTLQNEFALLETTNVDQSLKALMNHDVSLDGLHIQSPNLEDLFLKLTGHQLRS